eukprot:superscaffoldBa00003096_g16108
MVFVDDRLQGLGNDQLRSGHCLSPEDPFFFDLQFPYHVIHLLMIFKRTLLILEATAKWIVDKVATDFGNLPCGSVLTYQGLALPTTTIGHQCFPFHLSHILVLHLTPLTITS